MILSSQMHLFIQTNIHHPPHHNKGLQCFRPQTVTNSKFCDVHEAFSSMVHSFLSEGDSTEGDTWIPSLQSLSLSESLKWLLHVHYPQKRWNLYFLPGNKIVSIKF